MIIDYCVFCHNFQRRLCWVLSNICQQKGDVPDIRVQISSLKNNGSPSTEEVVEEFSKRGLDILHRVYPDEESFARRGIVRNNNIKDSMKDWIFFADSDSLYEETFFETMKRQLCDEFKGSKCIASFNRHFTVIETTNEIMDKMTDVYIEDAFQKASNIETTGYTGRRIASGSMQLAHYDGIMAMNNGLYVNPKRCKDKHLFKRGQKARSDVQFRHAMGGTRKMKFGKQIHLNHYRDKHLGYHSEDQR